MFSFPIVFSTDLFLGALSLWLLSTSSQYQLDRNDPIARDIYGAVFEPRNSVVIRRLTLGESVWNSPVPPNRGWGYLGDLMRLFPGTAFVNSPVIWRVPRISNVILGIYLRKWPFLSPVFCNLRKYISGKFCKHFEERLLKVPATRFRKLVSVDCHSWGFS
jgi:hypothetical protein